MDEDEFRYLLGRQMGAIRFGHPRLAFIFGRRTSVLSHSIQWILFPRQLAFSWWYRPGTHVTGQASGLAGRGMAVATILKENVRPMGAQVPVEATAAQVSEAMHGRLRWSELVASLGTHQPPLMRRLYLLVHWANPPNPVAPARAD